MGPLKRQQVMTLDDVLAKAERGAAIVKMAGTVSGRQERKSARGNRFAFVQLSDPTGQYEVTIFSDTLEAARDHLETGAKVIVTVEATMEADQLKLLGRSIAPADDVVVAGGAANLRVFIDRAEAFDAVASVLDRARKEAKRRARGEVRLTLMAEDLPGEVEITLADPVPVTPEIRSAVKSLPGVVTAEEY